MVRCRTRIFHSTRSPGIELRSERRPSGRRRMKMQDGFGRACARTGLLLALLLAALPRIDAFGAQSAAQRAVEEAKKYAGSTITLEWQAGLQALDPLNYS